MVDVYTKLVEEQGLSPTQKKIIEIVGKEQTILEVGASSGYLTREFKENGCLVDIIEKNPQAAKAAKIYARTAFIGSTEDRKLFKKIKGPYDFIIFADVLEHLVTPEIPLNYSLKVLRKNGRLLISLPNIASWPARKELFFKGKFEYEESGLFDKTHLRFFTFNSFQKFLKKNEIDIVKVIPTETYLPFQRTVAKIPVVGKTILDKIYRQIAYIVPNLAYFHYIVIGEKRE